MQEVSTATGSVVRDVSGFLPQWHPCGPEDRAPWAGLSSAPLPPHPRLLRRRALEIPKVSAGLELVLRVTGK